MNSTIRAALAATLLAASIATLPVRAAVEAGGVRFEDHAASPATLLLNGAGVRTRFMFKVYAMGLYLPARATTPDAVLATPGPKRVHLVTLRDLGADQFVDALVEGLEKNHAAEAVASLQPSIQAFRNAMLAVKKAPAGTTVLIDWVPGSGTRLTVAGVRQGDDIPDERFYQALLRVWLGDRPADADLKARLLAPAQ